ncbi:hypothetical protein U1Q18_037600 [Sarracenia purpurea var. burkii]
MQPSMVSRVAISDAWSRCPIHTTLCSLLVMELSVFADIAPAIAPAMLVEYGCCIGLLMALVVASGVPGGEKDVDGRIIATGQRNGETYMDDGHHCRQEGLQPVVEKKAAGEPSSEAFMQGRPATHAADTLADSAAMANEKGIDSNSNLILNSYAVETGAEGPNTLVAVKESLVGEADNTTCREAEFVSLRVLPCLIVGTPCAKISSPPC